MSMLRSEKRLENCQNYQCVNRNKEEFEVELTCDTLE